MSSFNGSATSTYVLKTSSPTFSFGPGANIDVTTPKNSGIYGGKTVDWNVTNSGSIAGETAVVFGGNATFDNTKTGKLVNPGDIYTCVYTGGVGKITNAGSIIGAYVPGYTASSAIFLKGGGSIDNSAGGVIDGNVGFGAAGVVTNAGSITNAGKHFSDFSLDDGGKVKSSGEIALSGEYGSGVYVKLGGTVTNSGDIAFTGSSNFHDSGINLAGAAKATNAKTGVINVAGTYVSGIFVKTTGQAVNKGKIEDTDSSGAHTSGMDLAGAGSVTNSGTINLAISVHAAGINIENGGGTAINKGKININVTQYTAGLESVAGGSLTNSGTRTINVLDHASGIDLKSGGAATNSGKISVTASSTNDAGVELDAGGTFTNSGSVYAKAGSGTSGVSLSAGGTIINKGGGSIADVGGAGIYVDGSAGVTITNAGKISALTATHNAIHFANAGTSAAPIVNQLTLETGSDLIGGGVLGSTGPFVTNDLTLEGKGSASNPISDFQNLTVDKHAVWTLGGADVFSNAITDQGSLTVSSAGALGGPLTIDSGGLAIFDSAYDGDVTFAGKGELELTDTYTGIIGGLAGHDSIDFLSDKFAKGDKVSVTDDVLTIASSSNSPIVTINLSSSLPASDFTLGADTSGHLLLKFT